MKNKFKICVSIMNGIVAIISTIFLLISNGTIKLYSFAEKNSYGQFSGYSQSFLDACEVFEGLLLVFTIVVIILNVILIKKDSRNSLWCGISIFAFGVNVLGIMVLGMVSIFSVLGVVSFVGLLLTKKE